MNQLVWALPPLAHDAICWATRGWRLVATVNDDGRRAAPLRWARHDGRRWVHW